MPKRENVFQSCFNTTISTFHPEHLALDCPSYSEAWATLLSIDAHALITLHLQIGSGKHDVDTNSDDSQLSLSASCQPVLSLPRLRTLELLGGEYVPHFFTHIKAPFGHQGATRIRTASHGSRKLIPLTAYNRIRIRVSAIPTTMAALSTCTGIECFL